MELRKTCVIAAESLLESARKNRRHSRAFYVNPMVLLLIVLSLTRGFTFIGKRACDKFTCS